MAELLGIYVPKETVNDEFATVAKLYVKKGDEVKKGNALIDLETSKTIVSIEAECDGFIELFCAEGEDVEISAKLMSIVDKIEDRTSPSTKSTVKENASQIEQQNEIEVDTQFSTQALLLMEDNNIPKDKFINHDFVDKNDVLNLLNPNSSHPKANVIAQKIDTHFDGSLVEIEPLTKAKKTEIKYLSDIQSGVMNSILNVIVDVGNIDQAIEQSFKIFKGSYLPLIVYEVSKLLKKHKAFNAYYMDDNIAYYKNVNVGMAIDIDDGLKVLTLPNSDKLNMDVIESKLYNLVEKYLDKQLKVEDVTGSTFTITDLSSSGIDFFTPLINTKQSAILGVSQVDSKLNRFYLTLVFDHRVTEGKVASEFLVELKDRIESYSLIEEIEQTSVNEANYLDIKCGTCFNTLEQNKEMDGHGMMKIINHQGKEDYICHICLSGF